MSTSSQSAVDQLLAIAGVSPGSSETAAMVDAFAGARTSIEALYKVPGVRYELPALSWSAIP